MQLKRVRRQVGIALFAMLMLVLQAAIGSFDLGAQAAAGPRDIFGNPLCITNTVHDGGGQTSDHHSLPDCCTLGCTMVSQLLATPEPVVLRVDRPVETNVLTAAATLDPTVAPDHDPGQPRAPPLTA